MAPGFSPEAALYPGSLFFLEGGEKLLKLEISLQACKDLPLFHALIPPSGEGDLLWLQPTLREVGRPGASFGRVSAQHFCLSSQKSPRC